MYCLRSAEIKIINRSGLHARPAVRFVQLCSRFKSRITICKGDVCVDSKNILKVLSLSIDFADTVMITVEGEDEDEALNAITNLLLKELPEEDR